MSLLSTVIFLTAIVLAALHSVEGRSTGAPAEACVTMTPDHPTPPQVGTGPIEVVANIPNFFNRSEVYEVVVRTIDNSLFRGFFCQVRGFGPSSSSSRPYGSFQTVDGTQNRDCSGQFGDTNINPAAAITHTRVLNVNNISVYWIPPAADIPLPPVLEVRCSVVVTYLNYYVQVPSARVSTDPNTALVTTVAPPTTTPYTTTYMPATTYTSMPYTGTPPPAPTTPTITAANCAPLASATTDDERYEAYLTCWRQHFDTWYYAFQRWLASGGQACVTPL